MGIWNAYLTAVAHLDAHHSIGHAAPSHLFFQYARDDRSVSAEEGQRFFELASEPKQISWYENCDHEFNAQARLDRAIWLCETLHLPQPSQKALNLQVVLIQKNGDSEVEASFTEHEVASSKAIGLTYCNIE